jgi:hypothetical protein
MGYMATLALLQASMTAVSSAVYSEVSGKPDVSMIRVLRPGTVERSLASVRRASMTL